jgi:hypothetical protein
MRILFPSHCKGITQPSADLQLVRLNSTRRRQEIQGGSFRRKGKEEEEIESKD